MLNKNFENDFKGVKYIVSLKPNQFCNSFMRVCMKQIYKRVNSYCKIHISNQRSCCVLNQQFQFLRKGRPPSGRLFPQEPTLTTEALGVQTGRRPGLTILLPRQTLQSGQNLAVTTALIFSHGGHLSIISLSLDEVLIPGYREPFKRKLFEDACVTNGRRSDKEQFQPPRQQFFHQEARLLDSCLHVVAGRGENANPQCCFR